LSDLQSSSSSGGAAPDYLLQLIGSTCFNIDDDRVPILLDDATYFGRRT